VRVAGCYGCEADRLARALSHHALRAMIALADHLPIGLISLMDHTLDQRLFVTMKHRHGPMPPLEGLVTGLRGEGRVA
jgi:hypothetical protein